MQKSECRIQNAEFRMKNSETRRRRVMRVILNSSFCILTSAFMLSCSKDSNAAAAQQKPGGGSSRPPLEFPVEAHPVESRLVEYTINAVGSLDAFERVAVTARVPGAVERVLFREGQVVQRGQTLVEIEP